MMLLAGLVVVAVAVYAIVRKIDVRLVLLLAAFALAIISGIGEIFHLYSQEAGLNSRHVFSAIANPIVQVLRVFLITFSNEKFVVPICSAMGFAFVLRETQCDQHLVRLLIRPFQAVRALLVPGTVIVSFLVNVPLISQTSTAVAVGTVLVPLLRAARIPRVTIGAALVLGSSLGGELLNRAAPELRTVADALKASRPESSSENCVEKILPLIWPHLLMATLVFWLVSWWADRKATPDADEAISVKLAVNPIKALVPFVPLVLLFLTSPAMHLLHVPESWLTAPGEPADGRADSRLIGAAMLVGVLTAALAAPGKALGTIRAFFEGAGYGFTHIISLIVTATCFGEGIKLIGVNQVLGKLVAKHPAWLIPLAALVPLAFATLSGSGMAATQSVFQFYVEPSEQAGIDPFLVGAVVSIAAAVGRTISPVAAVTLMCAKMTETNPFALSKRVVVPALAGLAVVVALAIMRH
ncbi:MAG TPA: C4-dicarboxylate transporter DcuC [Gemmataceae bacterium]|jgi:DcuC family C4-dicarboxylate transporter|nr:C4-dicarboxylate transporter DcuC [Gemmataceae bacterium]